MPGRVFPLSLTRNQRILTIAVVIVIIAGAVFAAVVQPWNRASAADQASGDLSARITANEQVWQKMGITNYRIAIRESRSSLAPVSYTVVLTVWGGQVIDRQVTDCHFGGTACSPDYPLTAETDEYTVPGLFSWAHALATEKDAEPTIEFDPTYRFPRSITVRYPTRSDSGGTRIVTQFDPLS
jgi:hypothetical protein